MNGRASLHIPTTESSREIQDLHEVDKKISQLLLERALISVLHIMQCYLLFHAYNNSQTITSNPTTLLNILG